MSELNPERIAAFAARIRSHPRRRMLQEELWIAFASSFPGRPQGADERQWLVAALGELETQGLVRLPRSTSPRWERVLGVPVPKSVDVLCNEPPTRPRDWRTFPWHPRLHWVGLMPHLPPEQEAFLRRVHDGLVQGWFAKAAPLKYRSLQLTGDEKRLGVWLKSKLFGAGRLDLDLLACLSDAPPLAWERVGDRPAMLAFENAGAFSVARQVLRSLPDPPYGLVAFGDGGRFEVSVAYILGIGATVDRIDYVGDLDRDGLRIALGAAATASRRGLPAVRAAAGLHGAMLRAAAAFGSPLGWPVQSAPRGKARDERLVSFLPADVRDAAARVLDAGNRIPEEVLGPEELASEWAPP